jgi:hypothetical protein
MSTTTSVSINSAIPINTLIIPHFRIKIIKKVVALSNEYVYHRATTLTSHTSKEKTS